MESYISFWLKNHIRTFFAIFILIIAIIIGLTQVSIGPNHAFSNTQFSVIIQHFGLDGKEVENTITTPLEHLITRISGIKEIRSTSERNKSRVNIVLNDTTEYAEFYFALREAVDILYTDLPASVQRPQIFSSALSQKPFIIISFLGNTENELDNIYDVVDETLKPQLQKILGVGEIEIGGSQVKEIHIVLDNQKAQQYNLQYQQVAEIISQNYQTSTIGLMQTSNKEIPIVFKGRLERLYELEEILIPTNNTSIKLKDIATVKYSRRAIEKISRVNGKKNITIYIKSSDSKYMVSASNAIKKELDKFKSSYSLEYNILYDYGAIFSESIDDIRNTLLIAILIISIFLLLCYRNFFIALAISIFLPLEIFLAIAIVSIIDINISIELLIGVSIGIGLLTDTGVIITNEIHNTTISAIPKKLAKIIPPLFASIVTTIIVMTPLFFLPHPTRNVVFPIIVVLSLLMLGTFLLHITFFPILYTTLCRPKKVTKPTKQLPKQLSKNYYSLKNSVSTFFITLVKIPYNYPKITTAISGTMILIFFISLFIIPKTTNNTLLDEPTLFGKIEFESGTSVFEVDKKTDQIKVHIRNIAGVERIETFSNANSSTFSINFNKLFTTKEALIEQIRIVNAKYPSADIIIRDITSNETRLEIALIGRDTDVLRAYAKELSTVFLSSPIVTQSILHFKEGNPMWTYTIDQNNSLQKNLTPQTITEFLRWKLFGPVSLKWFDKSDEKERDLRVMGESSQINKISNIQSYSIKIGETSSTLNSVGSFKLAQIPDTIYHLNTQRAVYFSILLTDNNIARLYSEINSHLTDFNFAKGYSYRIDKTFEELNSQYTLLIMLVILAIIITYMFLAGYYESFVTPVIIIIGIPLSLSFGGIVYLLLNKNFSIYSLIAMTIVIGLVVNNIILYIDKCLENNKSENILNSLYNRAKPVLITSFSTLLSIIPMIATPSNSILIFEFAFVLFLGIVGSLITTFFILPSLLKQFPKLIYKKL